MDEVLIVFDLDGVVIDSAHLVRDAYVEAGVVPPEDILAQEGVPWIAEQVGEERVQSVRATAHAAYVRALGQQPWSVLPPYYTAIACERAGQVCAVMTGAPVGSCQVVRSKLRRWPFSVTWEGVKTPRKMEILRLFDQGVYIDDQSRLVEVPRDWRFVHYSGQESSELYEEVRECSFA